MAGDSGEKLIVLARLSGRETHSFDIKPGNGEVKAMTKRLGLMGLRKVRLHGELLPEGKSDWQLRAFMGATVVQQCVVTLDPVTTRLDETLERRYLSDFAQSEDSETEMSTDDTIEPLVHEIDLQLVLEESLSLALPTYPKAVDAKLANSVFAEEGVEPLTDKDVKPFAGLASLRDQLADDDQ